MAGLSDSRQVKLFMLYFLSCMQYNLVNIKNENEYFLEVHFDDKYIGAVVKKYFNCC